MPTRNSRFRKFLVDIDTANNSGKETSSVVEIFNNVEELEVAFSLKII